MAEEDTGAREGRREKTQPSDSPEGGILSSLWPWPALATVVIALAGYLFGWPGAVVAAGTTVTALLSVAAYTLLDHRKRAWLFVPAAGVGTAVALVLFWQVHAIGLAQGRSSGRISGPADLVGRTVTQAMLKGLNLRGATLSGTKLDYLSLTSKNLNGAVAPGSSFIGSDLRGVPMRGAELPGANFSWACLRGADLAGAELNGANITGADISGIHLPSSVRKTLVGKPASSGTHVRSCH